MEQVNALPTRITKRIWRTAQPAKVRMAKEKFYLLWLQYVFKPRLCHGHFKSSFSFCFVFKECLCENLYLFCRWLQGQCSSYTPLVYITFSSSTNLKMGHGISTCFRTLQRKVPCWGRQGVDQPNRAHVVNQRGWLRRHECPSRQVSQDSKTRLLKFWSRIYVGTIETAEVGEQQSIKKGPWALSCHSEQAAHATTVPLRKLLNLFTPWFSHWLNERVFQVLPFQPSCRTGRVLQVRGQV